jgi:hypothetical protein
MKTNDLLKVWGAFDNKRLCAKQFSIRLPVHVAARISALCDMFPSKTKTDIISDLLASALDHIEESLPIYKSEFPDEIDGKEVYGNTGPKVTFHNSSNNYYRELEKELGNPNPRNLY